MSMNILVVDDDELLRNELSEWLTREGYDATSTGSGETAVDMVKTQDFNLILTDLKMPGMNGLDVLKAVKKIRPSVHMIMITAYGTIDTAVEAMKIGADDYICKPFEMDQMRSVIENMISEIEFEKRVKRMEKAEEPGKRDPFELFKSLVKDDEGMCITVQEPETIKERYDLKNLTIFQLTSKEGDSFIHPKNVYDLKLLINGFFSEHPAGVVLFDGLEIIIEHHSWDVARKFISDVLKDTPLEPSRLIISIKAEHIEDRILTALKRLIASPYTQLISESLSSPIRRDTVKFLSFQDSSSFSGILNELDIKDAPKLSFHLKRLVNDRILTKDAKKIYSLTDRGKSVAHFLVLLERESMGDVQNNILLISSSKIG